MYFVLAVILFTLAGLLVTVAEISPQFGRGLRSTAKASYPELGLQRAPNHLTKTRKTVWFMEDGCTSFDHGNQVLCFRGVAGRENHSNARS